MTAHFRVVIYIRSWLMYSSMYFIHVTVHHAVGFKLYMYMIICVLFSTLFHRVTHKDDVFAIHKNVTYSKIILAVYRSVCYSLWRMFYTLIIHDYVSLKIRGEIYLWIRCFLICFTWPESFFYISIDLVRSYQYTCLSVIHCEVCYICLLYMIMYGES